MNATDIFEELKEQNDILFVTTKPTVLILSVLLPIGIVGNTVSIYVFGFCLKQQNTIQLLVTLLAVADFFACLVVIPFEILHLRLQILYPRSETLCKLNAFLYYFSSIISILLILLIAIERYKKICHPTQPSTSKRTTRLFVIMLFALDFLIVSPVVMFYKVTPVQVLDRDDLSGTACFMGGSPNENFIHTFMVGFGVLTSCIIIILYFLIWRKVRQQYASVSDTENINTTSRSALHASRDKKQLHLTKTVVLVTVLFVVCHIPHYAETVYQSLESHDSTSETPLSVILIHSVYLSCSLDPLIYAFFNSDFRYVVLAKCGKVKESSSSD